MPHLVVGVTRSAEKEEMNDLGETLYMYRSLEWQRFDAPKFVTILQANVVEDAVSIVLMVDTKQV